MINMYKLGDKLIDNCGNKAMFLSMLKAKGYNVPLGIVIDFEEFKNMVKDQNLNFDTIEKLQVPDRIIDEVFNVIPKDKMLAVRSSANIEDEMNYSLAGRYNTFLNVAYDKEGLKDKIKSCFLSLYSEENLIYYKKNQIDINKVEMNVIVQEMIESNVSGILFTVNPTNGKDTQVVIEFSRGAGEVVSGKTIPERIVYDWKSQEYIEEPKINLLGETSIRRIVNISLTLQQELGFPIDLEFGVYDSKLYIFQIRPITKVEYKDIYYRYSNTNKSELDILSPFILSIGKDIYTRSEIDFAKNLKNISDNDVLKPVVFSRFSRFYWNLSFLKNILQDVPGYVERYLDEYLKVRIDYLDNGVQNLQDKDKKIWIFSKKNGIEKLKKQVIDIEEYRNDKLEELKNISSKDELSVKVKEYLDLYIEVNYKYLYQQFVNSVFRINLNQQFNKILSRTEIESLVLGIDNKYENAPYLHMWDTSRKIRRNNNRLKFFENNLDAEIYYFYRKDRNNENIKDFLTDFIELFGYHSFNESDIIYKTFEEEVLKVIRMYRDILDTDDKYDPLQLLKEENKDYELSLKKLEEKLKPNQYKSSLKHIEFVRELIKKEYALKDLTLICRAQLRKSLLELGKVYKEKYILDNEEDIFYLEYSDILSMDKQKIKNEANKNKIYYNSFRNYIPQSDIFPCLKQHIQMDYRKSLKGIGASFGKVSARACVVNSKEDLKSFKRSDIIITKYVDSELFKNINLSQVSGIVTEFGGMLCHFAINARENRIPCIVGIKDITNIVRTGESVIINGATGEVII
ncbi:MAG: PEP/pyruvate-binding domain-containing protein [Clostridia bacterium]